MSQGVASTNYAGNFLSYSLYTLAADFAAAVVNSFLVARSLNITESN